MRANKLQTFRMCCGIGWLAVRYSIQVLLCALFHKKPRARIDKLIRDWSSKMLRLAKVDCRVINPHNVKLQPGDCYIIMSNHASHFDIPLILNAFPQGSVRMLAKKELFDIPLWGMAMTKGEFLKVDRGNREEVRNFLQVAQAKMISGIIPWIAPEGTRSRTGELQQFKKGGFVLALETCATIIPVTICDSNKILPAKTLNFGIGESVEIHIAAPIKTINSNIKDMRLLMQQVEESIRRNLPSSQNLAN